MEGILQDGTNKEKNRLLPQRRLKKPIPHLILSKAKSFIFTG
jgi:hypothetical protein